MKELERGILRILILAVAIPVLPLVAQEAKKAEDEKKPKATEEITVTARKKEETLQQVPISVAAPTESELRDRGAQTIEDVAANVAGFTVQNLGPGQSQIAIRGVSSGQIVRDQPGVKEQVGVYLDESVISLSLFTPDLDLFDLSRVEVLRGPQGTLFGSGSESGTVRYITNQPKIGTQETIGEVNVETIDTGGTGGSVKFATNVPMTTTSAARLTGYYMKYGGFIGAVQPNLSIKTNVNDGYRAGARASFLFKPNAKLSITPRLVYQKLDVNGWNRIDIFNILGNPYTTTRPRVLLSDRQQFTQIGEPTTDKFLLGDVNFSYDLGGGRTLSSITSYTDRDILVTRDAGALTSSITGGTIALPQNVYTLNAPLFDATTAQGFTEELRVSGTNANVQWVAGGFYAHNKRHYGQNLPVKGFTALTGIPTEGTKIAETDELYKSDLRYTLNQAAIFGEGTYTVNPRLDITAGLRWYDFSEDRTQIFDGIFADPIDSVGSVDANGFAPRIMASFKATDTTRLYGQIAKGFRLGGINDPLLTPLCSPGDKATFGGHETWEDETLWNYEIGSKSRVMNGRGGFNVAAFMSDVTNLQATVTAGTCSSRLIFNVPKARAMGAEVEFDLTPTDNFDFAISASHTNSELRSNVVDGSGAIVAGIRSGARMPSVPEDQAAAAATYRWPTGSSVGYLSGVWTHIGDRFTQVGDEDLGTSATVSMTTFPGTIGGPLTQSTFTFNPKLPAYDLINLRVGILKGRWDTAVFVNNITDERALLALDRERGFRARVGYMTNQPRTFGISTRMNF
jgi:iron complex outermembrane receptor protein